MNTKYKVCYKVSCPHDSPLYAKTESFATEKEAKQQIDSFINNYGQSKAGYGLLRGLFIVRTDNKENFAKDFSLPTFFNITSKINNTAGKIFASLFAIAIDAITLPVRLISSPVCALYNRSHQEESHPLENLITGTEAGKKAIKDGNVSINVRLVKYTVHEDVFEDGVNYKNVSKNVNDISKKVALRSLPGGVVSEIGVSNNCSMYSVVDDKEWISIGHSRSKTAYNTFMC